jgi:hypothetical protein
MNNKLRVKIFFNLIRIRVSLKNVKTFKTNYSDNFTKRYIIKDIDLIVSLMEILKK